MRFRPTRRPETTSPTRFRLSFLVLILLLGCAPVSVGSVDSLRGAIEQLSASYPGKYRQGAALLKRLDSIDSTDAAALAQLRRDALTSHPLITGTPILFVCRQQYLKDHHNTATLFQTGEINTGSYRPGGPLKSFVIGPKGKTETEIFNPGAKGLVRDPDVSFDGKKILCAGRRSVEDDYHIYELQVGKPGVTELTRAKGVSDIDPIYLPDGSIVFSSTREPKYCMCNRHIMANLFKMEGDGANIHQIGKSTLFEGHSSLMPDGRILYDRWEYIDRNFGDAQGLWVVNPDGTNHALFWGNNTASPGGVIDARIIPGSPLCVAILGNCHSRPRGALAIIDRSKGTDGSAPILQTWPASAKDRVSTEGTGKWDSLKGLFPKYEDPWPLDANFFLVSRTLAGKDDRTGIFLIDTFGNELLLHQEADWGCYDPMPITPRPKPLVRPDLRDLTQETGVFYVQDVYTGTHMDSIEPGEIKFLRVVESPEKRNWVRPAWGGQGSQSPAMNWHSFESKRILGTVAVEEDGSAYFEAPADTYLYFQALDKKGMMVQSMRSGAVIAPGEVQGCVGCHENRVEAPLPKSNPKAMQRRPDKLIDWKVSPEPFSYMAQVQPIWDRHCVSCHDFDQPAGEKLVLAGDRTLSFNASYIDIWSRDYITCAGGGPAAHYPAKSWGSHASKLMEVLIKGHPDHEKVALSDDELVAVATWIDLNAPYYPNYECAYPNNPFGRSPLTQQQVNQLGKLTGSKFVSRHGKNQRAKICFERPGMSPCLQKLGKGSPEYKEALAIIEAGAAQLKKLPRSDMPGFVPCESNLQKIEKYEGRASIEKKVRAAIVKGQKIYDQE